MIGEYTPKTQQTVEPEPMIRGWIKKSLVKYLGPSFLIVNFAASYATGLMLERGMSKKEIEDIWKSGIRYVETREKIPVINELIDFPTRPRRGLAYLIYGNGEK
jgi:hypothetical protein